MPGSANLVEAIADLSVQAGFDAAKVVEALVDGIEEAMTSAVTEMDVVMSRKPRRGAQLSRAPRPGFRSPRKMTKRQRRARENARFVEAVWIAQKGLGRRATDSSGAGPNLFPAQNGRTQGAVSVTQLPRGAPGLSWTTFLQAHLPEDAALQTVPPTFEDTGLTVAANRALPIAAAGTSTGDEELDRLAVHSGQPSEHSERLIESVRSAFRLAREVECEEGFENDFQRGLRDIVGSWGEQGVLEIENIISSEFVERASAYWALRYLGDTPFPGTRKSRRLALERMLASPAILVRDGAALGLASMDDPASIPAVERALHSESNEELVTKLSLVLHQLEETNRCPTS